MTARIRKAGRIDGQHLTLRDANEADAWFIHGLRTDPARARFLSPVSADVQEQRAWLARYALDDAQAYFIVTDAASREPLGTVRLYEARGESFSWGSWLFKAGLPARCAIESALVVYHYGRWLGFSEAHFAVHQENVSVWRFHENFGARRVGARGDHFQYELSSGALTAGLRKYQRYLPGGINVHECQ